MQNQELNKGSYRIGKIGFSKYLSYLQMNGYILKQEGKFYKVQKEEQVLTLEYKENGWITIS